jgi:2',3'-cyclic-nucleotide 2'-phosphodiesterase (5'-nucleotidase family)
LAQVAVPQTLIRVGTTVHRHTHAQFTILLANVNATKPQPSGFNGLVVPKFAGSSLAEAVGFFGLKKSSARLPSEGK